MSKAIKKNGGGGRCDNTGGGDIGRNCQGDDSHVPLRHRAPYCAALCAGADGVTRILHIDSSNNGTALGHDRTPNAKVGVWA